MAKKRLKFKKFQKDLNADLKKDDAFGMLYQIESAKLKIADKLVELREKMGLTQVQLAKKMKVSQQFISKVESGSDNITIESLIKFCDILGVTLSIDVEKRKKNQEILEFV